MKSFLSTYYRIWRIQALLVFVQAGLVGLIYLLFFKENVTLVQLFVGECVASIVVSLYLLFRHVFFLRGDIQFAFLLVMIGFSLLFLPFTPGLYYVYVTISGLASMTFFTPYNILLFREQRKDSSVQDMTWYWGVSIIVAIVGPLLGAYLLTNFGLVPFISLALIVAFVGIVLSRNITKEHVSYTPKKALTHISGIRLIVMLDGALHRIMRVVPLFGLLYISKEMEYGSFLSLMSLMALGIALFMAKASDKSNKRIEFIWPLSFAAGIITALFGFVTSAASFIVLAVLLKAVTVMVEPLRGHVMIDAKKNDPVGWISRELYLNIGRALLMGMTALFFYADAVQPLFAVLGFLHILFPIILSRRNIYGRGH